MGLGAAKVIHLKSNSKQKIETQVLQLQIISVCIV